jgi:hypothetical protein
MELYHGARHPQHGLQAASERASQFVARRVVSAFDEVRALPPVLAPTDRETVYRLLPTLAGLSQPDAKQRVQGLLEAKVTKGLL